MEDRNSILSEIREVAPALESISREMPFSIPEGYFELVAFDVLSKLGEPVYRPSVPEGYFETLPGLMLAKVKSLAAGDELAEIAPALSSISRQMPYAVPSGYFENFSVLPPAAGDTSTEAPGIPIRTAKKPWVWAAAASVIVLLGMFAWQYLWYSPGEPGNENKLASVAVDSVTITELATALEDISDTTLKSEVTDKELAEEISAAVYYLNTENFETALRDFTVEEIKSQLLLEGVPSKKS